MTSQPKNSCYSVGKQFTSLEKSKLKLFQIPLCTPPHNTQMSLFLWFLALKSTFFIFFISSKIHLTVSLFGIVIMFKIKFKIENLIGDGVFRKIQSIKYSIYFHFLKFHWSCHEHAIKGWKISRKLKFIPMSLKY